MAAADPQPPPFERRFAGARAAEPGVMPTGSMRIEGVSLALSLFVLNAGATDMNLPPKEDDIFGLDRTHASGTAEERRARRRDDQAARGREGISIWEPRVREYENGARSERDGFIALNRLSSFLRVLKSHASLSPEQEQRLIGVKERIADITSRHPDWPSMSDWRLSEEIREQEMAVSTRADSGEFRPKDRRVLEFSNDASNLVAQFQFAINFMDLKGVSSVDNQGGAIALKASDGTAVDWRELPMLRKLTFKRRFRSKTTKGVSTVLICTDPLHSWYSADSDEERQALKHSNWAIPWVNASGELGSFCGAFNFAGKLLVEFHPPNDSISYLLPLAVRGDGAVAVLVGRTIKRETGEGLVDVIGDFSEILIWSEKDGLRRSSLDPNNRNEVMLLDQFRAKKF